MESVGEKIGGGGEGRVQGGSVEKATADDVVVGQNYAGDGGEEDAVGA